MATAGVYVRGGVVVVVVKQRRADAGRYGETKQEEPIINVAREKDRKIAHKIENVIINLHIFAMIMSLARTNATVHVSLSLARTQQSMFRSHSRTQQSVFSFTRTISRSLTLHYNHGQHTAR